MKNIQIFLEKAYNRKVWVDRIATISPEAKNTVFSVEEKYPAARKIRGLFRRFLPHSLYRPVAEYLDPMADAQKIVWANPPDSESGRHNVLLFPPGMEKETGAELVSQANPHWIHSVTTGVDRIPALPDGTLLSSSEGVHSQRIAEFTMGVIFALAKNIPRHVLQSKDRIWKSLPSEPIRGKCLGIVGLGSIGTEIARLGKSLGMQVIAIKRKPTNTDVADKVLVPENLPDLLSAADYVVLAVPLTEKTYHLIGTEELKRMKPSACLVNICRGAVVDEDALYHALKNSTIRGACMDVFQDEKPLPKNSRFYRLPNLLISSFSAYYSADSLDQVMERFFQNMENFIHDKPLSSIQNQTE
ncbi:MAG: D-2-hydroxyacid dehydrogenase [Desulfobacterales bacterium]